jgi:hypothetical protein
MLILSANFLKLQITISDQGAQFFKYFDTPIIQKYFFIIFRHFVNTLIKFTLLSNVFYFNDENKWAEKSSLSTVFLPGML